MQKLQHIKTSVMLICSSDTKGIIYYKFVPPKDIVNPPSNFRKFTARNRSKKTKFLARQVDNAVSHTTLSVK
jgi:hypothetical protein